MQRLPFREVILVLDKICKSYAQDSDVFLHQQFSYNVHEFLRILLIRTKTTEIYHLINIIIDSLLWTKEEYNTFFLYPKDYDTLLYIIERSDGVIYHVDGTKTYILHDLCQRQFNVAKLNWYPTVIEILVTSEIVKPFRALLDDSGKYAFQYLDDNHKCYRKYVLPDWTPITHQYQTADLKNKIVTIYILMTMPDNPWYHIPTELLVAMCQWL